MKQGGQTVPDAVESGKMSSNSGQHVVTCLKELALGEQTLDGHPAWC